MSHRMKKTIIFYCITHHTNINTNRYQQNGTHTNTYTHKERKRKTQRERDRWKLRLKISTECKTHISLKQIMHTQSFLAWGTSIRQSRQTRERHKLHSAPRFMYPNTRRHRAHDDFDSIIGLSNEPPFTLIAPLRRKNCKSARNVL